MPVLLEGNIKAKPKMPQPVGILASVHKQNNMQVRRQQACTPILTRMLNINNPLVASLQACEQFISDRMPQQNMPWKWNPFGNVVLCVGYPNTALHCSSSTKQSSANVCTDLHFCIYSITSMKKLVSLFLGKSKGYVSHQISSSNSMPAPSGKCLIVP